MSSAVKSKACFGGETMASEGPPPDDPWSFWGEDGESAAANYELTRKKLTTYFAVRRVDDPAELAAETLDRLMQNLIDGVRVDNLLAFGLGIAKNVFYEYLRGELKAREYAEGQKRLAARSDDPGEKEAALLRELQLECLGKCKAELDEHERRLLDEFYKIPRGRAKIEHRKMLAELLNISGEKLSSKIFNIKKKLKKCIDKCIKDAASR